MQDSFYKQAALQQNPAIGMVKAGTARLQAARTWLEENDKGTNQRVTVIVEGLLSKIRSWLEAKTSKDGLSVQYLHIIANARFGIAVTAYCLHAKYCQQNDDVEFDRQVSKVLIM